MNLIILYLLERGGRPFKVEKLWPSRLEATDIYISSHLQSPLLSVPVLQCLNHLGCASVVLPSSSDIVLVLYCEFQPITMGEQLSGYYDLHTVPSDA